MTLLRTTLLASLLATTPIAALAATVVASDADVLLDDVGGGALSLSGNAMVGPISGPFATPADIFFAIEYGPNVPSAATGFFEVGDGTALLAGIPVSVLFEETEAVVRLAFNPGFSTITGFEQGFFARFDFGADPASLVPGAEYTADISVAPVPLPGSAALLLMAGVALAGLGRMRKVA